MAVANDARPEPVRRELLDEVILVPRQQRMRAVAQVRANSRTGADSALDDARRRGRVPQGHDHAAGCQLFYEWQGAFSFRGQGQEADAAAGGVLQTTEFVPAWRADMLAGMGAARTVF